MNGVGASIKKIRAIVMSCHNPRYFENTIEPKLERYHIDMVKKIDPNRQSTVDLSDCDVVILLLELMPSQHVALIRAQANRQGKKLITLHRDIAGWERAFARDEDQRVAGAVKAISPNIEQEPRYPSRPAPPPPPSRALPPPATKQPVPMWGKEATSQSMPVVAAVSSMETEHTVEEAMSPEYAEYLALLESDNTALNTRVKELDTKVRELETAATRQVREFENLLTKNKGLDETNKSLSERVKRAETEADRARTDLNVAKSKHKDEVKEFEELLRKAGYELEKVGKGIASDVERAFKHLVPLVEMGVMQAEHAWDNLKKLAKP